MHAAVPEEPPYPAAPMRLEINQWGAHSQMPMHLDWGLAGLPRVLGAMSNLSKSLPELNREMVSITTVA